MLLAAPLREAYRRAVFPLMGLADPELAHTIVLEAMALASRVPGSRAAARQLFGGTSTRLGVSVLGLTFPNPLGLAAGFDKNGIAVDPLLDLGFGFVEVGTVTPREQAGNLRPRLHRLEPHQALINSLGFPNLGKDRVAANLRRLRGPGIVGVNLGKGRETPLESAADDYVDVLDALYDVGAYAVINVSSPNTQGLRQLQARNLLTELTGAVVRRAAELAAQRTSTPKPVLLKIAPDLTWEELDDILTVASDTGVNGIVATNTTVSRAGIQPRYADLPGGLSGRPLQARSTEVIRYIAEHTEGHLPIIGMGGIFEAADVWDKLAAGASLVQAYTGFIYQGPTFAADLRQGLIDLLDRHHVPTLAGAFPHLRERP